MTTGTIAERLRQTRELRGLARIKLAAQSGVNVDTIGKLETGRIQRPTSATTQRLAWVLDVDPRWLRDGAEDADLDPQSELPYEGDALQETSERAYLMLSGMLVAALPCDPAAEPFTLGRGREAGLRLPDAYASRIHATLTWDPDTDTHVLTDHGSANGTSVDNQRITRPTPLRDGCWLRIGRTHVQYVRG